MIYPISIIDDYGTGGLNPRLFYAHIDITDDYGNRIRIHLATRKT